MEIKASKKNIKILAEAIANRLSKAELLDLAIQALIRDYSEDKESFAVDWKVLFEDS